MKVKTPIRIVDGTFRISDFIISEADQEYREEWATPTPPVA
jgi:hypothetical protein